MFTLRRNFPLIWGSFQIPPLGAAREFRQANSGASSLNGALAEVGRKEGRTKEFDYPKNREKNHTGFPP